MIKQVRMVLQKNIASNEYTYFCSTWTTSVENKYLEVFFEKSGAYKRKYTLKPLLSQNMVHSPEFSIVYLSNQLVNIFLTEPNNSSNSSKLIG